MFPGGLPMVKSLQWWPAKFSLFAKKHMKILFNIFSKINYSIVIFMTSLSLCKTNFLTNFYFNFKNF